MGNILASDGIKSGTKISRKCENCQIMFESWSDDTMTIKGPMSIQKICDECHQEKFKDYNPFENSIYNK
jgi:hypothetical protein